MKSTAKPLRILVISNLCPPDFDGGFELSALRNTLSLRRLGHEVDMVTSRFRASFEGDRVDVDGVHRIFTLSLVRDGWSMASSLITGDQNLGMSRSNVLEQLSVRWSNLQSNLSMLSVSGSNEAELKNFLKDRDYDVAYAFGLHLVGTSMIHALMEKQIPVVYHHGDEWLASYLYPKGLKSKVLKFLRPAAYGREQTIDLRHVVLVSHFMAGRFKDFGFQDHQLGVIHRGFEHEMVNLPSSEKLTPPIFFVASRLAMYKGIQIALRAALEFHEKEPNRPWQLWIAGTGDEEAVQWYEQFVKDNKLDSRVQFLGKLPREKVVETMRRCTAFLSPSVFDEPFGNTNIEAMASGATLIASKSGAIEEIIEHGVSGLIYERSNASELAGHMQLVLDQPDLSRKLADQAFQRVKEKFHQDQIIRQVEAKLASVAGVELLSPAEGQATLR